MPIRRLQAITYDFPNAQLTYPFEIEGSPTITTDAVTQAKILARKFVVRKDYYVPLEQGVPDFIFKDCYLINENTDSVSGPLHYFTRNYAQLPESRTEPRQVAFSVAGQSKVDYSMVTGWPVAWNPYGKAAPYTRPVMASVEYSYELYPGVVPIPISTVKFNGAPVDYSGEVYEFVGNVEVPRPGGVTITESRWKFIGFTDPSFVSGVWIVEAGWARWQGPIWEKTVVKVNTAQLLF